MKKSLLVLLLASTAALGSTGNGKLTASQYDNTFCSGYMGAVIEHSTQDTPRYNEAVAAIDYFNTEIDKDKSLNDDGGADTRALDIAWRDGYNVYQLSGSYEKQKVLMPKSCLKRYGEYLNKLFIEVPATN